MMDTVLNLGLNDETALGLTAASGDERFLASIRPSKVRVVMTLA